MKVEILKDSSNKYGLNSESIVSYKKCGSVSEIKYSLRKGECYIRKLSKDLYYDIRLGEVKEFSRNKAKSRKSNEASLVKSFKKLRDLINANCEDTSNVLFITLTYKYQVNLEQLYLDFRNFNLRLKRYAKKNNFSYDYIQIPEPTAKKNWHIHLLLKCSRRVFIDNKVLASIWSHGFVNIKAVRSMGVDNIGVYLTSYLTDLDMSEITGNEEKNGKKSIIKGARLNLYPVNMKIFRASRGIVRPKVEKMTEREAMEKVKGSKLTYDKTIQISLDDGRKINIINTRHFNQNASRERTDKYYENKKSDQRSHLKPKSQK